MMPKLHTIGSVAGKHGFKGSVSLLLQKGSDNKKIKKGNFLFIMIDGKGVPFLIDSFQAQSGIVKFQDIDSEEETLEILGCDIAVEVTEEESDALGFRWYEGFVVKTGSGILIGAIQSIEEYPAGEMLKLDREGVELLIPAVQEWILKIDKKAKVINMDLPEGLLDL